MTASTDHRAPPFPPTPTPTPPPPAPLRDQASRLRDLVESSRETTEQRVPWYPPKADATPPGAPCTAPGSHARLLAIASGKGGVGKSNVCVSLSAALASLGVRVVLLDGDLGLANADVLCGVSARLHLGHVIDGDCSLSDILLDAPGGFRLAPGAGGVARLANLPERRLGALVDQAAELERDADLLIIDCGAGLGPTVLAFLHAADKTIVITTPEPTAVADAYGLIKTMSVDHPDAPAPGLLINQARDAAEAVATHERIASVAQRFLGVRPEPSGWIPLDPSVPDAVRRREPFVLCHPRKPAANRVRVLAHDLRLRMDLRSPAPHRPQGRLSRVLGRLARL